MPLAHTGHAFAAASIALIKYQKQIRAAKKYQKEIFNKKQHQQYEALICCLYSSCCCSHCCYCCCFALTCLTAIITAALSTNYKAWNERERYWERKNRKSERAKVWDTSLWLLLFLSLLLFVLCKNFQLKLTTKICKQEIFFCRVRFHSLFQQQL